MEILRDRNGNPQGMIPEIAGKQERLFDRSGNAIATYRRRAYHRYDNNGTRFSSGNRLAGIIDKDDE
jgi:hypothetical protein